MPSRFFRRSRAVLTGLALCGAATAAVLPATGGAASAAQVPSTGATATGPYITLAALTSRLYLDIQGASIAANAPVIQWTATDTASEAWHVPALEHTGQIRNQNSGMCLTTDGVAGDQLYQEPCRRSLTAYQEWAVVGHPHDSVVSLDNPVFGLLVDVYQNNTTLGGPIDAWPYTGQLNQAFIRTPTVAGPKG